MSSLRLLLALLFFACPVQALQLVQQVAQQEARGDDVGERGEDAADPAAEDGVFVGASVVVRPPPQQVRRLPVARPTGQLTASRLRVTRRAPGKRQRLHRLQRRVFYGDDDGDDPEPSA